MASEINEQEIEKAKEVLAKHGYAVENLWHIADVKSRYNCTDEEAMEVMNAALQNEATMEQIWYALSFHADDVELKKKED